MPDTTGRIRAKALDTTGFTEPMLEKAHAAGAGRTVMALVELRTVEPHGPNIEGKKRIDYVIESIEPVPVALEDRIRDLQRGLFLQRPEQEGQATIQGTAGDNEADLSTAADAVAAVVERDDEGNPIGVWTGDPEAPLTEGEPEDKGDKPWPGDEGYVAPDTDPAPDPAAEATDEVAAKRGRKKADPKPAPAADPAPVPDEAAARLAQARAGLGEGDAQSDG